MLCTSYRIVDQYIYICTCTINLYIHTCINVEFVNLIPIKETHSNQEYPVAHYDEDDSV